jgi:hypothetical protein
MEYRVETVQLPSGRWQWEIFKGDELQERGTTDGYMTAQEARNVASDFLYDHVAGWCGKQPQPQMPTPKMDEPAYSHAQIDTVERGLAVLKEMGL